MWAHRVTRTGFLSEPGIVACDGGASDPVARCTYGVRDAMRGGRSTSVAAARPVPMRKPSSVQR